MGRLRELRKQAGFTQAAVAEQLKVTQAAVSDWESGKTWPSTEKLRPLAQMLKTTVDELLSNIGEQPL